MYISDTLTLLHTHAYAHTHAQTKREKIHVLPDYVAWWKWCENRELEKLVDAENVMIFANLSLMAWHKNKLKIFIVKITSVLWKIWIQGKSENHIKWEKMKLYEMRCNEMCWNALRQDEVRWDYYRLDEKRFYEMRTYYIRWYHTSGDEIVLDEMRKNYMRLTCMSGYEDICYKNSLYELIW